MRYQVRDMRHVMKIGPVELENGSASAYVAFGESGLDVVLEATDDKGLAALRRTSLTSALQRARVATTRASPTTGRVGR